jgi:formate dehydrogenase subunit gamma
MDCTAPTDPAGAAACRSNPGAADETFAALLERHGSQPDALLPLLHGVQRAYGHVPAALVPAIARALNLSRAEVHGVITYYADFRSAPPGRHLVRVCRAESCLACGAEALLAQAEEMLGCACGATRADGEVTLEAVHCLGLCAASPALAIDGRLAARVTQEQLAELLGPLARSA